MDLDGTCWIPELRRYKVCELLQMVQKTEIYRVLSISVQFWGALPCIYLIQYRLLMIMTFK